MSALAWSKDGKTIAFGIIVSDTPYDVLLWDVEKKRVSRSLKGHTGYVQALEWSPDGRVLASGTHSADGTICLWDSKSWEPLRTLKGHSNSVLDLAWSPDGRTIVSGGHDKVVRIWDVKTGQQTKILEGTTDAITSISFSYDGEFIASKFWNGGVLVWQYDRDEIVGSFKETVGTRLQFHPNQLHLATVDGQVIRVWELDAHTLTKTSPITPAIHYSNAKVVLVGETSTGKTCLARALMGEPFEPQESTHGMKVWNFHSETIQRGDGGQVMCETLLWDLAGQVDYQVVHQLFLDATVLGIVMFDPTAPENPFAGVGHWEKALRRVVGDDYPRLLVAGRVDRGHPTATAGDIDAFCQQHGYQQFIATSAKTGQGVEEIRDAIRRVIPWERLPITSSPELWKQIREYLLSRRADGDVLTRRADLRETFRQIHIGAEFSEAEFDTVIGHAQTQGLMWRLSFGDFVLLKPELLNNYAAAIVRVARRQQEGLGCVAEQDVLEATVDFEDLERLAAIDERSLLHAVIQLLLQRELALRESGQLVFPSKFNRQRPDIPEPQPREVAYRFAGSVEEIYTTLVVRLFYCRAFALKDLWKNAAEFHDSLDNLCGFFLDSSFEGQGVISVFFAKSTSDSSKVLFLRFVHEHLHQRSLADSVQRHRIYYCPECGEEVENRRAIEVRLSKGSNTISCQFCDATIELVDVLETKFANTELLSQIRAMEREVVEQKDQAVGVTVAGAKDLVGEYDVFLAHNSVDKLQVEAIGKALKGRGLNPWLDKEQIPPGRWFQDVIQQAVQDVKSAAIFIGPHGLGRWQIVELRSFVSQCVDREIPVIPVLLPGVVEMPRRLVFLNEFTWVKFNEDIEDIEALDNLEWGITGEHPKRREP